MSTQKLRGIWTALVTPFAEDGSVDVDALKGLVLEQLDQGLHGLVPCGTTGETATLDEAEQNLVITTVLGLVKGKVPVVAGAGANDTRQAVANHKRVAGLRSSPADGEHKITGALHVTPWYNKPTQEGLYRHFRAVADAADLPIIVYNVPGRTGVDLLPDTLVRLAKDEKKIVAVKEATGSVQRSQEIINKLAAIRPDFSVFSGDDGHILSLLAIGGDGVISVTSHLCGKELVQMVKAFDDGDMKGAQALSRQTSPLSTTIFWRANPIPVKTALALTGRGGGKIAARFRLPMCPLDEGEVAQLKKMLTADGWL
ncbi:MAG: 4-hydroxy-tetrahydrodipicolinate synthase [Deltaproteobacteria bacterium]|nr:4-hydroxy-tetrahydrodipicolinate synthase [Deltaproteobacteria bacterium]